MKRVLKAVLTLGLAAAAFGSVSSVALASDVRDGKAMVVPAKDDRFSIDGNTFGKAELFGYISDLKDREKLTGIVLRKNDRATDAQRKAVGSIARTLQLEAFTQDGSTLTPMPAPAAAPPADAAAQPPPADPAQKQQ